MKCPHCGQEHPDNTKFCPETGKKMEFELLSCPNPECVNFGKHILPKDSKFCPDCGTKLNVENEQADESFHSSHTLQHVSDDDFVDLGLSVKWAKCNLGAKFPEEYGNYYAWGETNLKDKYSKDNSRTHKKNISCIAGNLQYDVAIAVLGRGIRLPTKEEFEELEDNCSTEWTIHNGVTGLLVTGPNDNSIFFPAAGYRRGKSLYDTGKSGLYWSSTPNKVYNYRAFSLEVNDYGFELWWNFRSDGYSVRPVREIKV